MKLKVVEQEEGVDLFKDLWQEEGRQNWYEARFSADDMPDWNPATYVSQRQLAPEIKQINISCQTSRQKIPLRNAYKHVGQKCKVRVNGSLEYTCSVASPPFDPNVQKDVMLKVRGDIRAGQIKRTEELIDVMEDLQLWVHEKDAPELYNIQEGDFVEIGPFKGNGIDLRGPIAAIYRYNTVAIFATGRGIASARALINSSVGTASMCLPDREDVRLYYSAPNKASLCYKDEYPEWENYNHLKVIQTTSTLQDAFDEDDTFAYEPDNTCALIFTGGNEEEDKQIRKILEEAEITTYVSDIDEQQSIQYRKGESMAMPRMPKKTVQSMYD